MVDGFELPIALEDGPASLDRKKDGYLVRAMELRENPGHPSRFPFSQVSTRLGCVLSSSLASGIHLGQSPAASHRPNSIARSDNDAGA